MAAARSPFLFCSKAVGVEGLKRRQRLKKQKEILILRDRVNTTVHPYRKREGGVKMQRLPLFAKRDNANNKGQTRRSAPTITRNNNTNRRGGPMCPPKKQTTR